MAWQNGRKIIYTFLDICATHIPFSLVLAMEKQCGWFSPHFCLSTSCTDMKESVTLLSRAVLYLVRPFVCMRSLVFDFHMNVTRIESVLSLHFSSISYHSFALTLVLVRIKFCAPKHKQYHWHRTIKSTNRSNSMLFLVNRLYASDTNFSFSQRKIHRKHSR